MTTEFPRASQWSVGQIFLKYLCFCISNNWNIWNIWERDIDWILQRLSVECGANIFEIFVFGIVEILEISEKKRWKLNSPEPLSGVWCQCRLCQDIQEIRGLLFLDQEIFLTWKKFIQIFKKSEVCNFQIKKYLSLASDQKVQRFMRQQNKSGCSFVINAKLGYA